MGRHYTPQDRVVPADASITGCDSTPPSHVFHLAFVLTVRISRDECPWQRGMQSVECDFVFTLVCRVYFYHVFDCSYEIQLCEDVRRKGLGKFLMQILELMAFKYASPDVCFSS